MEFEFKEQDGARGPALVIKADTYRDAGMLLHPAVAREISQVYSTQGFGELVETLGSLKGPEDLSDYKFVPTTASRPDGKIRVVIREAPGTGASYDPFSGDDFHELLGTLAGVLPQHEGVHGSNCYPRE